MMQAHHICYYYKNNNNNLSRIHRYFRTDQIGIYGKNQSLKSSKRMHFLHLPFANILQYCETKRKDHSYVLHLPDQGVGQRLIFFNFSPHGSRVVECFSSSFQIYKVEIFVLSHILFFTVYQQLYSSIQVSFGFVPCLRYVSYLDFPPHDVGKCYNN